MRSITVRKLSTIETEKKICLDPFVLGDVELLIVALEELSRLEIEQLSCV